MGWSREPDYWIAGPLTLLDRLLMLAQEADRRTSRTRAERLVTEALHTAALAAEPLR